MILRTTVGLLIMMIICLCFQQKAKGGPDKDKNSNLQQEFKSGLKIENSPTRGTGFTDSLGTKFGLVYITTTFTNVSTIPIQLQIAFSKEYDYPKAYGDEQFRIIILPNEWTQAGVEISDEIMNDLLKHNDKSYLNANIKPTEKYAVTIGLIRPIRPKICSATPYAFMEYSDTQNISSCEWVRNEIQSSSSDLDLGLKVGFCTTGEVYESCYIISCGKISYIEN